MEIGVDVDFSRCDVLWQYVMREAEDHRLKNSSQSIGYKQVSKTATILLRTIGSAISFVIELDSSTRHIKNPLRSGKGLPKGKSPELMLYIYQEINIDHESPFYSVRIWLIDKSVCIDVSERL